MFKYIIILASLILAACNAETDQSTICKGSPAEVKKRCKAGDLIWIQRPLSERQKMPLIAEYCDTNKPVHSDQLGMICTYTDKRLKQF